MATKGINKRLLDKRLELDYSSKEASIRLDISRLELSLIEHGYIKVRKSLKPKFIRKYKLEPNFFEDDFNGYPTPIVDENKPIKINKFHHFFLSWFNRIALLVLATGFAVMAGFGLTGLPRVTSDTKSFYEEQIITLYQNVTNNGIYHPSEDSIIGSTILDPDGYHSFEYANENTNLEATTYHFYGTSLNFFTNEEFLEYSFITAVANVNSPLIGTCYATYETRLSGNCYRTHFNIYDFASPLDKPLSHISADLYSADDRVVFNLVEVRNLFDELEIVHEDNIFYAYFTYLFSNSYDSYLENVNHFFDANIDRIGMDYSTYKSLMEKGTNNLNGFSSRCSSFILYGFILSILFIAIAGISIIIGFSFDKKLTSYIQEEDKYDHIETRKELAPLPKNKFLPPFIPEVLIRILVLVITLASSIGLYTIFACVQSFNVIDAINAISFKAEISSLTIVAMCLLFFTKLDIKQGQKNTFLVNYALFFLGLLFYIMIIVIQYSMSSSSSIIAQAGTALLDFLPGNIVWGILSFNLLTASLFSNPNFKKQTKGKVLAFRLTSIIPISYMFLSSLYIIGKNAWGWNLPLAVSSLLFSKALYIMLFAIFYCLFVYFYKHHTFKKYGPQNALIYQNGNRYIYTKNIIVCLIIVVLSVVDLLFGKFWVNNPFGLGGNYICLFAIPFILFYRPHMGKRNGIWDISFAVLYALSMTIGFLMISGSLSAYIISL